MTHEFQDGVSGMSARQYAAIQLGVPDSGQDWLDAMIRRSLLHRYAGQALAILGREYIARGDLNAASKQHAQTIAKHVLHVTDAMLAAIEESKGGQA